MRCCQACKTPYFCGNKFCWCHAFQLDDATLQGRPTYPDPTGDKSNTQPQPQKPKKKPETKMKHEFTDEQLQLTILDASDQRSIFIRTARELEDIDSSATQSLRTLLYHLPEPGKTYITNVGIQQQIGRLQDLTSSENEAVIWLSTLNHLVATSADRKRILKQDTQDGWQECAWGDVLHTDERVKAEYISGTVIEGVPDGISDNGVYLVDGNLIPYSTDAKWYRIPAPVKLPDPDFHPVVISAVGEAWVWDDADEHYIEVGSGAHRGPGDFGPGWVAGKVVADNDC